MAVEKTVTEIVAEVKSDFDAKIKTAKEGSLSMDEFKTFKASVQEKLDGINIEESVKTAIHEKHAELITQLSEQGAEIALLKESSKNLPDEVEKEWNSLTRKAQFNYLITKGMETDSFKSWFNSDCKGATPKLEVKTVTGLAADHTGDIFITESVPNVRDIERAQPHMRDYLSASPTEETQIAFPEVENFTDIYTLGTQMLSENEEVTDVSFDSKENTSTVVRMGVSMNVSKRYFRGKSRVIIDHVLASIPDALQFKEDVQILHGSGDGNNLSGILDGARSFNLTPSTYAAAAIESVASYDEDGTKTLVTFAAAHGLLSGDRVEFALATESTYNATHSDILLIDETKIVINLTYVAESDTSAWTGTGYSYWYQSVDGAQEVDCLIASASILEAGLYGATAVFVNPQTTRRMSTLKATDLQYIGVARDVSGRMTLDGMPIVAIPAIPAGWFLIGDFSKKNIEIRDYTTMSIQFLEDVTTKKTNSIVVLADEEIHLVKYNPKWYVYDRFSTAKTQLEKPDEL